MKETWYDLDDSIQQGGTVLEQRRRGLARGRGLTHKQDTHRCKLQVDARGHRRASESHLSRTQREILLDDLQQEVRVELLEVLHPQRKTLERGEVCVHRVVQEIGHFFLGTALFHSQHCTQVE